MERYGSSLAEYSPELEAYEFAGEFNVGKTGVFNEAQELELAAELLEVNNEQELEQFLGDIINKVGKAVGGIVKSPIFKSIGGVLKSAAKVALPIAGGALGTFVGGPIGTSIGSSLGSALGNAFEFELEGLSQEDREFETARQFIRFAGDAVRNAMQAPPDMHPAAVAARAAEESAREHAPGLVGSFERNAAAGAPGQHHHHHHRHHHHGDWVRHGNKIVLYGL